MNVEERFDFDYVVVGSGAGGGPLAANLARSGMRVLLLEAGGDDEGPTYQVPAFHAKASEDEALRWDFFVRHYGSDERQERDTKFRAEHDGVLYPRSGTLGGCTAHSAMITLYPHASDFDRIAEITDDASWRSEHMRRYFERLERCEYVRRPLAYPRISWLGALLRRLPLASGLFRNRSRHGFDGWLGTSLADPKLAIGDLDLIRIVTTAAKESLEEGLGRPLTFFEDLASYFDPNDWRAAQHPQGLWLAPLSTSQGRRNGTREYLRAVAREHPDRLTVKTRALATRVLLDDANTAVGVEYLEGAHLYRADPRADGRAQAAPVRRALAAREVILAAGAFNTPQLLKLSGIGPRRELEAHGIEVRADLPGVGENLQDRYEVGVVTEMEADFRILAECTFEAPGPGESPDPCFTAWQRGEGLYTSNGHVIAIVMKSAEQRRDPDLFVFGIPTYFKGYYPGYSGEHARGKNLFTWGVLKAHTRNSAGSVTLRSADPRDVPHVNFRYFDEGNDAEAEDLESVVEGVEFVRGLMRRLGDRARRELVPGAEVATRDEIRQFVKNEAWGHHASCTCRIGRPDDRMAVLDGDFRVHGTRGLRVVDASAFPYIPGFFILTAIYMISEKATDAILATGATGS